MAANTLVDHKRFYIQAMLILFSLLFIRLISMYVIPLNDSTEARYGEISRTMLETGNWITLMQDGEPFWAKPPLSTWLSAGAMRILGVNEFAARLPALLLSLGVLWLVFSAANVRSGRYVAMLTVLVLSGTLFFFIDAGTVMTDPALLFCTTLILISFFRAIQESNSRWGYAFFVGIGLGLLAKGPIAIVLTGLPIFFWVLLQRKWSLLWTKLPWLSGTLLTLAIAMPWYILAESKTPGFLNYFIMGEHVKRFLEPGWSGDKYGFAHVAPYGMIWLYALAGFLPWSLIGLGWLVRHLKQIPSIFNDKEGWIIYLALATLLPLIFFTFSSNIIYPYVFPSLPTFALLFVEIAHQTKTLTLKNQMWWLGFTAMVGIIFVVVALLFVYKPQWVEKSQIRVIAEWKKQKSSANSQLIYWANKNDYSSQFYSAGTVKATSDTKELCLWLASQVNNYIVVRNDRFDSMPALIKEHLTKVASIPVLHTNYDLLSTDSFDWNQCAG